LLNSSSEIKEYNCNAGQRIFAKLPFREMAMSDLLLENHIR
jgi:hypothetical protein